MYVTSAKLHYSDSAPHRSQHIRRSHTHSAEQLLKVQVDKTIPCPVFHDIFTSEPDLE